MSTWAPRQDSLARMDVLEQLEAIMQTAQRAGEALARLSRENADEWLGDHAMTVQSSTAEMMRGAHRLKRLAEKMVAVQRVMELEVALEKAKAESNSLAGFP